MFAESPPAGPATLGTSASDGCAHRPRSSRTFASSSPPPARTNSPAASRSSCCEIPHRWAVADAVGGLRPRAWRRARRDRRWLVGGWRPPWLVRFRCLSRHRCGGDADQTGGRGAELGSLYLVWSGDREVPRGTLNHRKILPSAVHLHRRRIQPAPRRIQWFKAVAGTS